MASNARAAGRALHAPGGSQLVCGGRRTLKALYAKPDDWARRTDLNVADLGSFSSDRTVAKYAKGDLEPATQRGRA